MEFIINLHARGFSDCSLFLDFREIVAFSITTKNSVRIAQSEISNIMFLKISQKEIKSNYFQATNEIYLIKKLNLAEKI